MRAVRSPYDWSQSLVRTASSKSNSFLVVVGLRQGCPFLTILFITFIDRISRRSQHVEGVRFGDFRIGSLPFVDNVVLLTPLAQLSLYRFADDVKRLG